MATHMNGPGMDEPLAGSSGLSNGGTWRTGWGRWPGLRSERRRDREARTLECLGRIVEAAALLRDAYTFTGREWEAETLEYYYRARFYQPEAGRFGSADPLGFAAGTNRYAYVENSSVNWTDPLGLFGDGGVGASYPGHTDFPGHNDHDYKAEDYGDTGPFVDPERHFRDLPQSEADVRAAIAACNKGAFDRAMHRGQDYFSHYRKGYRYDPKYGFGNLPCGGMGHACAGTRPDEDYRAFQRAQAWTRTWLRRWQEKCDCPK